MSIRHGLRRTFFAACVGCALCTLQAGAALAAPLALQEALNAARTNLDVAMAGRRRGAAQADIRAADHVPLPQLTARVSQLDLQNGIGGGNLLTAKRIDKRVDMDWTWERGDKRGLRTEAARRAASAATADVEDVRTLQALAAYAAFFDLLSAQTRVQHLLDMEGSARRTADLAAARVRAGDLAVQDAARAAIEAERARADTESARLDVQRAQIALALWIGREADATTLQAQAEWPMPGAEAPAAPGLDELIEQRAGVRAAAERVLAAESALRGASAQRSTDITWGASLDHYPGTSTRQVELRLSMPLTWGYHYEGEIGRAQAQLEQARLALDKTRRAAAAELQRLRADALAATSRHNSYQTEIVPRAHAIAERAELAYGKGAMPLTDLLDARRTLRAVLLDALASQTDHAKALGAWQLRTASTP